MVSCDAALKIRGSLRASRSVCCCLGCANNLLELEQGCPMCRKPIESVLQLFFA